MPSRHDLCHLCKALTNLTYYTTISHKSQVLFSHFLYPLYYAKILAKCPLSDKMIGSPFLESTAAQYTIHDLWERMIFRRTSSQYIGRNRLGTDVCNKQGDHNMLCSQEKSGKQEEVTPKRIFSLPKIEYQLIFYIKQTYFSLSYCA